MKTFTPTILSYVKIHDSDSVVSCGSTEKPDGNDFRLLTIFYTNDEEYRGAMPLRKFDPVMKKHDISFALQIAGNKDSDYPSLKVVRNSL